MRLILESIASWIVEREKMQEMEQKGERRMILSQENSHV
jgi:hypothetical protein